MNSASVYEGAVKHWRLKPKQHRLRYSVFSFLLDIDRLDETAARLTWFSRGRFNLFSFYDCDYGTGKPRDLSGYIRGVLADAGYDDIGRIMLLAYPRMLGYAFNPLAVYYCYDLHDRLSVMIYEVRNTFGGRHSYLIPVEGGKIDQQADKVFHVSPFNDMNMRYRFVLSEPDENVRLFIQTADAEGPVLNAAFAGRRSALTNGKLLSLFFRFPLMTVKVIAGIHWEALKLLSKGMRLKPGRPDPATPVTVVGAKPPQQKAA